jgi:hypothetical protein
MYKSIYPRIVLIILFGLIFISQPTESYAQHKEKKTPSKKASVQKVHSPKRVAPEIIKLPTGHKKIVIGKANYYYNSGVFYKKSTAGYVVIKAPIGARINALPVGYITVYYHGRPYFHYYGTYYAYDDTINEYVVVEAPEEAEAFEETGFDKITLIDGSSLEGIYVGGTQSIIQFDVAGQIMEFPVEEVVSIYFSPAMEYLEE